MYKPWIIDYAERTNPETAYKNNTESTLKYLEKEAQEVIADNEEIIECLKNGEYLESIKNIVFDIEKQIYNELEYMQKWVKSLREYQISEK